MGSYINRLLNSCIVYFPTLAILGSHTVFVRKRFASIQFMLVFNNKILFITQKLSRWTKVGVNDRLNWYTSTPTCIKKIQDSATQTVNSKYHQLCLMFSTNMSSTIYVIQWYNSIQWKGKCKSSTNHSNISQMRCM